MEGHCSCGALLPEDARFCHKCGKPQRESDQPTTVEEVAPEVLPAPVAPMPPPVVSTAPPAIGLRNPAAVRAAFAAGGITAVCLMIPMPVLLQFLWMVVALFAGGFLAVWFYRRRSGILPGIRAGARLGWMAGLFCYLLMLVMFTLNLVAMAAMGSVSEMFRQVMEQRGSPETMAEMEQLLGSPGGFAVAIFGVLFFLFVMLTLLPTAGGAVGARVLDPE